MVGLADLDLEGLLPFLTKFYVLDEEGDSDNITDDRIKTQQEYCLKEGCWDLL